MKKSIIILIITIIAIIIILSSMVVAKTKKNEEATIEEKLIQELNYLNQYCISLLTDLNGIIIENETIKEDNLQTQFGDSTNNGIKTDKNIMNNSQENSKTNNYSDAQDTTTNNKSQSSILGNDTEYNPDWANIQIQIERLYQMWNLISLDLHSMNIDSNLVLSFSDELNNVTQNVKKKDKANTIDELVKLYNLIIEYTKKCKPSLQQTAILTAQYNIIAAYASVTNEKWEQAEAQVTEAQNLFANLINTVNDNYNKQTTINRSYILINELKKAIKLKDKQIFYLQYKTLISQFNILKDGF